MPREDLEYYLGEDSEPEIETNSKSISQTAEKLGYCSEQSGDLNNALYDNVEAFCTYAASGLVAGLLTEINNPLITAMFTTAFLDVMEYSGVLANKYHKNLDRTLGNDIGSVMGLTLGYAITKL